MGAHLFTTARAANAYAAFVSTQAGESYRSQPRPGGFAVISPRGCACSPCDVQDARDAGFEFPEFTGVQQ